MASSSGRTPSNELLIVSLIFSFTLILLDFSFQAPRVDFLNPLLKLLYSLSGSFLMFVLANNTIPDLTSKLPILSSDYHCKIVAFSVVILCIILALDIKTVGGLPASPYASFLSSFPVFCMVMIFGTITFKTCVKAIALLLGSLLFVEFVDIILSWNGISIVHSNINVFLGSGAATLLAFFVLAVTIISNILSILLAQQ